MKIMISLGFLLTCLEAMSFRQINYLPVGQYGGVMNFYDCDHDSASEFVFQAAHRAGSHICFYDYGAWNLLIPLDSIRCEWLTWAVGDFDRDGLTDMVVQMRDTLAVCEAETRDSFPKRPVWKWPSEVGLGWVMPTLVHDLDKDGRQDIFFNYVNKFFVFENRGDNDYQRVVRESTNTIMDITVGDYDLDGWTEIVLSHLSSISVYECVGDNQYRWKWRDTTSCSNSYDLFSGGDLDGDGRPEFMVGWRDFWGRWTYHFKIYEATGNDEYEKVFEDSVTDIRGRRSVAYSVCGDVDADGTDEIVWAIADGWYVYKAVGDDQYQRIFEAYPRPNGNGRMTTEVSVFDFNGNGYPEIFETGMIETTMTMSETKIWEIEGVRLHRPNGGEVLQPGSQFPITWEKFTPPGADSFSLFVSYDNALTFQTITTGLTANDTLFLWSVPDTLADSVKIMIWAYGPPRAGENKPRGTAWDFSDSTFAIRQTAVGEKAMGNRQWAGLKILQNPTTKAKGIRLLVTNPSPRARLQIYDVAGTLVRSFPITNHQLPITILWNVCDQEGAALPGGVYFVRLEADGKAVTRKVVVVE